MQSEHGDADQGCQQDGNASRQAREALVTGLQQRGLLTSPEVTGAFLAVQRELFMPPGTDVTAAYADDSVITGRDDNDIPVTSITAPWLQAAMLEQAELKAGMRALEIGSGGPNAAMMAEIVGRGGAVTSMDIDPSVVERARAGLVAGGHDWVRVVHGDAEFGAPDDAPDSAPWHVMIVTVAVPDLPWVWADQLCSDGRLVVPLTLRGLTRNVAFDLAYRDGVRWWESRGHQMSGFVRLRGVGAAWEDVTPLAGGQVGVRNDGSPAVDASALDRALGGPATDVWTGVHLGGTESLEPLNLWLASALDRFYLLAGTREAIESGLVAGTTRLGSPAVVVGDSLAYRISRPNEDNTAWEVGARGHGPGAELLAHQLAESVRQWDRTHRHGPAAQIRAYPRDTSDTDLPPGRVIEKRHTRVVISWPNQ